MRRNLPLAVFLAIPLLIPLGGCGIFSFCGHLFAPGSKEKTVEAEFDGLKGQRVAVVIFAQPGVDFAHPRARLDLTDAIAYELQQHVTDIKVLPTATVLKFQKDHLNWDTLPRRQLAKTLGVDYVLHLGMEEYTLSDPGSGLFRARITADANVYAASPPDMPDIGIPTVGGPVSTTTDHSAWTGRLRVIYPDDNDHQILTGSNNERSAKGDAHLLFAKLLARKFHQHKIPAE